MHTPAKRTAVDSRDRRSKSQRVVGRRTDAAHARVDLQVHGMIEATGGLDRLQLCVGVHGELETSTHCGDQFRGRLLAEHQYPALETRLTKRNAFLHQGHTQAGGAAVQRRPGDVDGTVAVPVGLHHSPHLGRRGDRAHDPDVVPNRVEIDVGPRPPAHSSSSSTAGIRSGRSLATKPCRFPRRPA